VFRTTDRGLCHIPGTGFILCISQYFHHRPEACATFDMPSEHRLILKYAMNRLHAGHRMLFTARRLRRAQKALALPPKDLRTAKNFRPEQSARVMASGLRGRGGAGFRAD